MSNVKIEISQPMLKVSFHDSGATFTIEDLPPSIGSNVRFEVRSLEGERGALRQVPHHIFRRMRSQSTREIISYLKYIFEGKDWLKPGVLHPIDPSKIHPAPLAGEKWSGYFVNLLMPRGSTEPHLSVYFLQLHAFDVPELSAEMLVSIVDQMFQFASHPARNADLN
jgi:hypothetical protein